jgi:hypothetical protein
MKVLICAFGMVLSVGTLSARLMSATWGTDPAAPVYAGQVYDVTLTLETLPEEEISGVRLDQGPSHQPTQSSHTENGRRYTVLRWKHCDPRAKMVTFPQGRLTANVTHVQTFGFMRTANTTQQFVTVPAFNYEVQDLPGEARGMPIGTFDLKLTADRDTFAPGEVRLLTATLTAREGVVPEDYAFTLAETTAGALYPFRITARNEREVTAQAHFVVSAETDVTLCLNPLSAFDLGERKVRTIECAPLKLRMQPFEESLAEDTTITVTQGTTTQQGLPLRFAPTEGAPIIGTLGTPWTVEETHGAWSRVRTAIGTGWIRSALLKE